MSSDGINRVTIVPREMFDRLMRDAEDERPTPGLHALVAEVRRREAADELSRLAQEMGLD